MVESVQYRKGLTYLKIKALANLWRFLNSFKLVYLGTKPKVSRHNCYFVRTQTKPVSRDSAWLFYTSTELWYIGHVKLGTQIRIYIFLSKHNNYQATGRPSWLWKMIGEFGAALFEDYWLTWSEDWWKNIYGFILQVGLISIIVLLSIEGITDELETEIDQSKCLEK